MKNLEFLTGFLMCIFITSGYAQPMDTIAQQVLAHSPELRKMDFKINSIESRAAASSWYPDPIASVSYAALPVETRLGAVPFQIGISQSIPWFGSLEKEKEAILAERGTILSSKQLKEAKILLNTRILYVQLYTVRKLIPAFREQADLIQRILNIANTKYETASASLSHILEIKNIRTKIMEKIDRLAVTETEVSERLNILRGSTTTDTIFTPDTLKYRIPAQGKNSYSQHPAIREKMAEIEHLRKLNTSIQAQAAPDFKVGLMYGNVTPRSDVDIENNGRDQLMINAGVQIPLWTEKYRQLQQANRFKQEVQMEEIASIEDDYNERAAELRAEYKKQQLRLNSIKSQLSRLERIIDLRIQEYSTNEADLDDILRTLNDQIEKENKIIVVEQKIASISYQYQFLYTKYQENE